VRPPFILPQAPAGVPQWAFLQVEDLGYLKRLINWYIDNRQISNGEFGAASLTTATLPSGGRALP